MDSRIVGWVGKQRALSLAMPVAPTGRVGRACLRPPASIGRDARDYQRLTTSER